LQQFRHAYDESPDNPEFGRRLAAALFETGRYSEVEPLLTKLVGDSRTTSTGSATLSLALAQTQMHLGKLSQAESTLRALIDIDDKMPKLHRTLGSLYQMQGRSYDASHEYEREYQVSGDLQSHRLAIFLATRH
jgi:predicted Zn-dependent protease